MTDSSIRKWKTNTIWVPLFWKIKSKLISSGIRGERAKRSGFCAFRESLLHVNSIFCTAFIWLSLLWNILNTRGRLRLIWTWQQLGLRNQKRSGILVTTVFFNWSLNSKRFLEIHTYLDRLDIFGNQRNISSDQEGFKAITIRSVWPSG